MDTRFKQRIVGAIVIIALGVIFLPMFFDNGEDYPEQTARTNLVPTLPERPTISTSNDDEDAWDDNESIHVTPVTREAHSSASSGLGAYHEESSTVASTSSTNTQRIDPSKEYISISEYSISSHQSSMHESANNTNTPAHTTASDTVKATNTSSTAHNQKAKTAKAKHSIPTPFKHRRGNWTVQIASFAQSRNAERMIKSLRAMGYHAYTHIVHQHGHKITQVFVGPQQSRADASSTLRELENKVHVKGLVKHYRSTTSRTRT